MSYRADQTKRNALANLSGVQRAQIARAQAEKTLARLARTERAKPPPKDDPPPLYKIDILGLEMQRGSPHWLSAERGRRAASGISEKRKKEIRDKHRAKAMKAKPAK